MHSPFRYHHPSGSIPSIRSAQYPRPLTPLPPSLPSCWCTPGQIVPGASGGRRSSAVRPLHPSSDSLHVSTLLNVVELVAILGSADSTHCSNSIILMLDLIFCSSISHDYMFCHVCHVTSCFVHSGGQSFLI